MKLAARGSGGLHVDDDVSLIVPVGLGDQASGVGLGFEPFQQPKQHPPPLLLGKQVEDRDNERGNEIGHSSEPGRSVGDEIDSGAHGG